MKKQKVIVETSGKSVLPLSDIWIPPDAEEFNRWLRATVFGDKELGMPVPREYVELHLASLAKINKAKQQLFLSPLDIQVAENLKKEIDSFMESEIDNRFVPGKKFLRSIWMQSISIIEELKSGLESARDYLHRGIRDWKTAEEKKKIISNEQELAKIDVKTKIAEDRATAWEAKGKPEKAEEIRSQATQLIPNLEDVKATGWTYKLTITDKKLFWREVVKSFDSVPMIDVEKIEIPKSMLNELAGKLKEGIGKDRALPWGFIKADQK